MNCRHVRKHISAWLDGETDSRLADAIETHLSVCPECRRVSEEFRALGKSVRAPVVAALPEGFAEAVMCEVRGALPTPVEVLDLRRWWQGLTLPARAGTAVAAALVMCAGTLMGVGVTGNRDVPKAAVSNNPRDVAASMVQALGEPGNETPAGAYLALTSTGERNR